MERCLFPDRVGISVFIVNMIKILFLICTLTWRVNNYFSRQGKGINNRNESTIIIMTTVNHYTSLIEYFCSTQLTVADWKVLFIS